MAALAFRQELAANNSFKTLLLRYDEAHQAQISQTAACSGRHGLEERLARWLLMAHDRMDQDELPLTQEFIAMMPAFTARHHHHDGCVAKGRSDL